MESFFRYISYVDYYKKGERNKNVGFLRWKLHNGEHQIEIQIKDLNCLKGNYVIKEIQTGKKLGDITIDRGIGTFVKRFPAMTATGEMYLAVHNERLYLTDIEGFLIQLNENEYLEVSIKLDLKIKKDSIVKNLLEESTSNTKSISIHEQALVGRKEIFEEQYMMQEKENDVDIRETKDTTKNVLKEDIEEISKESEKELVKGTGLKIIEPVHEDKWKQLCRQYPNVHPFPDKKIFISIKPEDFIVLQKEYQKLVHNSFLLHGFYNYGHMILGKLTEEEEAPVYVGVPGVYYEQEKKAAKMFGFVGFESAEHPVQPGSYGYYMVEVEI